MVFMLNSKNALVCKYMQFFTKERKLPVFFSKSKVLIFNYFKNIKRRRKPWTGRLLQIHDDVVEYDPGENKIDAGAEKEAEEGPEGGLD